MTLVRYRGLSMWPVLQEGDTLVLDPIGAAEARRGDVIAFTEPDGRLVVHRVIRVTPTAAFTKGDYLPGPDEQPVSPGRLAGRVVRRVRLGHAAPVAGGWKGMAQGRVLGYLGRLVPGRAARGGRVADCLLGLSSSCRFCWGHLLRIAPTSDGGASLLYLGRRPIGTRPSEEDDTWHIVWPYSLLVRPSAVVDARIPGSGRSR